MARQKKYSSAAVGFLKEKCSGKKKKKQLYPCSLPSLQVLQRIEGKTNSCLKCMLTIQIFRSIQMATFTDNFPYTVPLFYRRCLPTLCETMGKIQTFVFTEANIYSGCYILFNAWMILQWLSY